MILLPGRTFLSGAEIEYLPGFIDSETADAYFRKLLATACWHQPIIEMFGRKIKSPRLAAWYGDRGAVYRYSGVINIPLPWLDELENLRAHLESYVGCAFNSVLLNLYRDGQDSMGWHQDNELELGRNPVIASLSFGGIRRFLMRHAQRKDLPTLELQPTHGSLLLMSGQTQEFWRHAVPKTKVKVTSRLNLTFRQISV